MGTERQMSRVCFHKVWAVTDLLMLPKDSPEVRVAIILHSPLPYHSRKSGPWSHFSRQLFLKSSTHGYLESGLCSTHESTAT